MQKTEAQRNRVQQPVQRQGGGAALEAPQGEQIAQLEALVESSPQVGGVARLSAMANDGPAAAAQRKAAGMIHDSPFMAAQRKVVDGVQAQVAQREEAPAKPNNTGLPDNLKSGIESLSGMSMDSVRVHYNSSQPAQLNALAYAQGTDIHVGPGQEKHLPHEAWHVVQQAQGRVSPTVQMKDGMPINDDAGLEREADVMGERAVQMVSGQMARYDSAGNSGGDTALESGPLGVPYANAKVAMLRIDPDFVTFRGVGAGATTKPEMQSFYDHFVASEVDRFSNRLIDDDVKLAMRNADVVFRMNMLNNNRPNEVFTLLNRLVTAVNAAADNWDQQVNARAQPQPEDSYRNERARREDAKHYAGVTKEMELRGVNSRMEAHQLLNALQVALNGALGGGALGQVGIRGSAVTGIRSRTGTAFEQGTGQYQMASDASDLDFFFTCPALEAQIIATQHLLPAGRRLNAGGTMNAQYLNRWLTHCPEPGNGYPNAALLAAALTTFADNAKALIGRKCEVTFIGDPTAAGLAADPSTLIF